MVPRPIRVNFFSIHYKSCLKLKAFIVLLICLVAFTSAYTELSNRVDILKELKKRNNGGPVRGPP